MKYDASKICFELADAIANEFENSAKDFLIVGLNGAQGSGKSTLSKQLQQVLQQQYCRKAVVLSLDDFYKTKAERNQMAVAIHPLFATRGVPGTHDVNLAISLLKQLQNSNKKSQILIPAFDKAIDDRLPEAKWRQINGKIDIVIFEGWCIGALPQTAKQIKKPINELEKTEDSQAIWRNQVNEFLQQEYQELFKLLDMLIMLKVANFDLVYQHRLLQEQTLATEIEQMRKLGVYTGKRKAMNRDQVKHFVMYYQRLTQAMLEEMPQRADIVITVDAEHHYFWE